jgi:transposase
MTRPYSCDLRECAAAAVLVDGMTCRQAAKLFRVSVSSVVRWTQLKRKNGTCQPKPMGGRRPVILLSERAWVRARLAAEPDLTVRAVRAELLARGIAVSYGAVWAFLKAERLSFKKKPARRRAATARRGPQAGTLAAIPGPH